MKAVRTENLGGEGDGVKLAVPVVLALGQVAAVELAALELHRHDMAGGLVEQLHRYPQALAHGRLPPPSPPTLKP